MKTFRLSILLTVLMAFIAVACSKPESFRIDGHVDGLGSEEIEMYYVASDAGVKHVAVRAGADGSFTVEGKSPEPVFVELFRSNGAPIATLVAANGDRIKLEMTLDKPSTIRMSGTDRTERYSAFIAENAGRGRMEVDKAVAEYVGNNSGHMSATMVLLTMFDALRDPFAADSLLNLIAIEARPASLTGGYRTLLGAACNLHLGDLIKPFSVVGAADSVTGFVPSSRPWSLLVFTDPDKSDSLTSVLASLRRERPRSRLDILEVAVWGDSATWRRAISTDSATWRQAWVCGGPGSPSISHLAIPTTPFFIVSDSTGRQCLRTSSIADMAAFIRARH